MSNKYLIHCLLFFAIIFNVSAMNITNCTTLNQTGMYYNITADILNSHTSNCLRITESDITLDCQNHIIEGDLNADRAIYAYNSGYYLNNISIKNCIVKNWDYNNIVIRKTNNSFYENINSSNSDWDGIDVTLTYNSYFKDIIIENNSVAGFSFSNSYSNSLINISIIKEIGTGGFEFFGISNEGNNITDVLVNSKPIMFFDGVYNVCPDNQILNYDNNYSQIILLGCNNVTISATDVIDGVFLFNTNNSYLSGINASGTKDGIYLYESNNNTFVDIISSGNQFYGINLDTSYYNNFYNALINKNYDGVFIVGDYNKFQNISIFNNYGVSMTFGGAQNNLLNSSRIINSSDWGIWLMDAGVFAENNAFINNYFNSTTNIYSDNINNTNIWNGSSINNTNIINVDMFGGNYWATPSGSGFSQTCADDIASFGICDNYYNISTGNIDWLPLTYITSNDTIISSCQTLNNPGATYILNQSVTSTDSCFYIRANNITLDCKGYNINYSTGSNDFRNAIDLLNTLNATIKNCNILEMNDLGQQNFAIEVYNSSNNKIINNTITTKSEFTYAITLVYNSNNNIISNNSIIHTYNNGAAVNIQSSINNQFTHNFLDSNNGGIVISSNYNDFFNNNLITDSTALSISGSNLQVIGNTIKTKNHGIVLSSFSHVSNINISSNNIIVDYISGSNWVALSLGNVSNVNINNTLINLSGPFSYGISIQYGRDVTFSNVTIINDLSIRNYFQSYNLMDNVKFIDTFISKFNISGSNSDITFKETNKGELRFLGEINGTGEHLNDGNDSEIVKIDLNFISIRSDLQPGFNKSINISIYNQSFGYITPVPYRDGITCHNSYCQNYNFGLGIYNFIINDFSNYSINEAFTINITSPTEPIVIQPLWQDEFNLSWYNVTVNFTTNVPTTCQESVTLSSLSFPPSCIPDYCDDTGCVYICSSGGSGGGGSSYLDINENISTGHSFISMLSDNKVKNNLRCYDAYNNSVTESTIYYVARENNITVEWASILRSVLTINQSINYISSVTNYYNLTWAKFILTLPNTSTINYNYSIDIAQNVDERYDKNFTDTPITGLYQLNVTYYDIYNNTATEILNISVYESLISYFNTSSEGDYDFSIVIKDPVTSSIINVGNTSGGSGIEIPDTVISVEMTATGGVSSSTIKIPEINLSINNLTTSGKELNISNISYSSASIGNGGGFRYLPISAEAVEIENFTLFNTTAIYLFNYTSLNITDPADIVIFKSDYDFNLTSINYSSGHFYKINDSTYPLYLNETGEYVYINITSFSSFIITEDQATTEICGNSIDDDFDGSIDEGCDSDDSDDSSSTSSLGGESSGYTSTLSKFSMIIVLMDENNDTKIEISTDAIGIYESIIKVKDKIENVKFTFEKIDGTPSNTTDPISKERVFKYIEISQSVGKESIEKATLKFKVEKEWLNNNSIDKELVRMYRYTSKWDELSTTISKEDSDYIYYETQTPGFSYFKISGIVSIEESSQNNTKTDNDIMHEDTNNKNDENKDYFQDYAPSKQRLDYRYLILISFVIICILITTYCLFSIIKKRKMPISKSHEEREIQVIQNFIKKNEKNLSLDQTKKLLLEKGWKKEIIDKAINDSNRN